jgi:UDP-N-acetylmuramoylalanine--D-glutamate ligase
MQAMSSQTPIHEDLNYLVVGLGVTGYSVASYLLGRGYSCQIQDSREIPPYLNQLKERFPQASVSNQKLAGMLLDWADVLVVSPGLSIQQPEIQLAAELGKSIIGDIELFAQAAEYPVVAITGSNGKSTVTKLLGEMMRADGKAVAVGGNIGTAALDLLDNPVDYYVLELSSYQLETTRSLSLKIGTVLNLSEDHLDRYQGYDDYVGAKLRIYDNADFCVSNFDDASTRHDENDILFSIDPKADVDFGLIENNGSWLGYRGKAWIEVSDLKISGRHNWANCLAAMALASTLGVSRQAIIEALKNFEAIPHRSQWVTEHEGVEWINDSKATNPGAAVASIAGRQRPVILIAGGQSKNADMSGLRAVLEARVKLVLLMGEDAEKMNQAWLGATRIELVDNMLEAVKRAGKEAVSGDCVLLAPACASFDMYEKFEARGDDFMQQVWSQIDDPA